MALVYMLPGLAIIRDPHVNTSPGEESFLESLATIDLH